MKKVICQRRACWVDFYHEVEVDGNDDDAFEEWFECGGEYLGHTVADSIEFMDDYTEILDSAPSNIK